MNDLELLKEFRHELGADSGDDQVEAAWARLEERLGHVGASGTIPARRKRVRRWAIPAGIAVAVAALLFVLSVALPGGSPGGSRSAAAAVSFTQDGQYIVAVIEDPQAVGNELQIVRLRCAGDLVSLLDSLDDARRIGRRACRGKARHTGEKRAT